MSHHWVEGNCAGKCDRCKKYIKAYNRVTGRRCRWCKLLVSWFSSFTILLLCWAVSLLGWSTCFHVSVAQHVKCHNYLSIYQRKNYGKQLLRYIDEVHLDSKSIIRLQRDSWSRDGALGNFALLLVGNESLLTQIGCRLLGLFYSW